MILQLPIYYHYHLSINKILFISVFGDVFLGTCLNLHIFKIHNQRVAKTGTSPIARNCIIIRQSDVPKWLVFVLRNIHINSRRFSVCFEISVIIINKVVARYIPTIISCHPQVMHIHYRI